MDTSRIHPQRRKQRVATLLGGAVVVIGLGKGIGVLLTQSTAILLLAAVALLLLAAGLVLALPLLDRAILATGRPQDRPLAPARQPVARASQVHVVVLRH